MKNRTWILVFASILTVLALLPFNATVDAKSPRIGQNLGKEPLSVEALTLLKAHQLLVRYGDRPYWPLKSFLRGENVPADEAPGVVAHLIPCESQGRSVKHLDSNHQYSYGVLQIQASTWAQFEQESGLTGNPMNPQEAVRMGIWAVEHGYLYKWSCAKILKVVD